MTHAWIRRAAAVLLCSSPLAAQLNADFFGIPTSGPTPLVVMFQDQSTPPGLISTWAWDFDDDGVIDSILQNPTHIYGAAGVYTVSLTVTGGGNPPDTERKPRYTTAGTPSVGFTSSKDRICPGEAITFVDTSSPLPSDFDWKVDPSGATNGGANLGTYTHTYSSTINVETIVIPQHRVSYVATVWSSWVSSGEVTISPCTANSKGPTYFRLLCNEARGNQIFNSAANLGMPSLVTVASSDWQIDPGLSRANWRANEAGFGAIGLESAPGNRGITTNWAMNVTGSMTVAWWQRSTGPSGALAYAWGGPGGTTPRCFTGGVAGSSLLYRGSSIGDFSALVDVRTSTQWTHVALVVDDPDGLARWYVNGVLTNWTSFPPGGHAAANSAFHIGWHTAVTDAYGAFYEIDDFNMDGNAHTHAQIQMGMTGESAAHGTFDAGCPGSSGVPTIAGTTSPVLGTTFGIAIGNTPPFAPCLVFLGAQVTSGMFPLPLSMAFFGAPGCFLTVDPVFNFAVLSSGTSANLSLPIPLAPLLLHTHFYLQGLVIDPPANPGGFVMTATLDILINDC